MVQVIVLQTSFPLVPMDHVMHDSVCRMTVLGIMQNWACPGKNITQNPASISLYDNLAVLVRRSQAQKYLQTNPKPFQ